MRARPVSLAGLRAVAAGVAYGALVVAAAAAVFVLVGAAMFLALVAWLGVADRAANGWATLAGLLGAGLVLVAGLGRSRNAGGGRTMSRHFALDPAMTDADWAAARQLAAGLATETELETDGNVTRGEHEPNETATGTEPEASGK